jgi:hypothetical protein
MFRFIRVSTKRFLYSRGTPAQFITFCCLMLFAAYCFTH